jgi:RimJ/RimL family protein N-acetyltransferase
MGLILGGREAYVKSMTNNMPQGELPIEPPVDSAPAEWPYRTRLVGRLVTVEPLDPATQGDSLFEGLCGRDNNDLWTYLSAGPFDDRQAFDTHLTACARSEDRVYFTILDNRSMRAVGLAAYLHIEAAHRAIEVGSIVFSRGLQRTAGATEAMFLMAGYVFDSLRYRRYQWECNALNQPSRRAALRLGFTYEGVFRNHVILKGRSRDTAWFSMIDSEWLARKAAFERWLDPTNFDANGQQRSSLASFHERPSPPGAPPDR